MPPLAARQPLSASPQASTSRHFEFPHISNDPGIGLDSTGRPPRAPHLDRGHRSATNSPYLQPFPGDENDNSGRNGGQMMLKLVDEDDSFELSPAKRRRNPQSLPALGKRKESEELVNGGAGGDA
ncbi:unnamed protein product, partial [Heterosigma akashiwo]